MARRTKPTATPQSDLMTERIRNRILIPVACSAFLIVAAIVISLFELKIAALITGIAAIIPLLLTIVEIRRLIEDNRSILKDLSFSAEKNEEMINSFSHKIREPLNNLVLLGRMLHETSTSGKQMELVDTFIASTDNMVDVVNELTMETAGNIAFESRSEMRFKLGPTIVDTIELLKINQRQDQSLLQYDDKGEGESEFSGDPITIKQILIDLISTAIAAATGKIIIKIVAAVSPGRDGHFMIDFTLSTNQAVVFIGESRHPYSLADRLIKDSGGNWQETSTGSGSVLSFNIPVHTTQKVELPEASTLIKDLRKETKKKELKDLNILLVEDNPINQRITQLMLGPLVRRIETARNGKEALDMFGTSRYDLILMDIQMPVMNGLVSAEKIRALEISTHMHTPIIAITANAMLGDKEQCLAVGMDDYISKPIEPELLIEKINALI